MKLTRSWLDAQIEQEMERGCDPCAIRDMAALLTVREHLYGGGVMRQYGPHYDPDKVREEYHDESHLTRAEAEDWVRGMVSEDGTQGGRWNLHDIRRYAENYSIKPDEVVEFFAVLNSLYTDYGNVAKKHGVDCMEYWADMAKAFMHDRDAKSDKVKRYYEYIAKKGDE